MVLESDRTYCGPMIHAPMLAKPLAANSSSPPRGPAVASPHLPERPRRECPFVQRESANAKRVFEALVGTSAVAVQGNRKAANAKLSHRAIVHCGAKPSRPK